MPCRTDDGFVITIVIRPVAALSFFGMNLYFPPGSASTWRVVGALIPVTVMLALACSAKPCASCAFLTSTRIGVLPVGTGHLMTATPSGDSLPVATTPHLLEALLFKLVR